MNVDGYASFLVRLWRDPTSSQHPGRWRGEIEHVQSGERWSFGTLCDLLAFLQQAANHAENDLTGECLEPET